MKRVKARAAWLCIWLLIGSAYLAFPVWKLLFRYNRRFRRFCLKLLEAIEPPEELQRKLKERGWTV